MNYTEKGFIWKKGKRACVVLISNENKTYQVALNNEQMDSLIFILPQLFDDHVIKVLEEPLDITLDKPLSDKEKKA